MSVEGMRILKRIREYNMGSAERRARVIMRQAAKQARKPLTMKQLQEESQKRHHKDF